MGRRVRPTKPSTSEKPASSRDENVTCEARCHFTRQSEKFICKRKFSSKERQRPHY